MRILHEIVPRWATGGTAAGRQYLAQVQEKRLRDRGGMFLVYASFILMGLAILGRPFAYTFVGDALLIVGVWVLINSPGRRVLMSQSILAPLALFMILGFFRTLPFLSRYRIDAVRDAVIWGYGAWAFVIAGLLCASPERLLWMFRKYGTFASIFLYVMPVMCVVFRLVGHFLPTMPGAGVPLIHVKAGDVLCHLGAVIAYMALFNNGSRLWLKLPLIAVIVALEGTSRAALGSIAAILLVAFLAKPKSKIIWLLISAAAFGVLMLWVTGIEIRSPGANRGISFEELENTVASVAGKGDNGDRDATREWRLNWWKDIIHYTFNGRYFWAGKGFGVNLAVDDGYDPTGTAELRSPHNGHIMILARMGVPGFCLWVITQFSWLFSMLSAYRRARIADDRRWSNVFAFIVAYWVGFMVNATFDVFLEGPMGGVWFWSIFGIGIAAMWIFANHPEAMYPEESTPHPAAPPPPPQFNPSWNRGLIPVV